MRTPRSFIDADGLRTCYRGGPTESDRINAQYEILGEESQDTDWDEPA